MGLGMLCALAYSLFSLAFASKPGDFKAVVVSELLQKNIVLPVAANDTFLLATGCNNDVVMGNLLKNDSYDPDDSWLSQIDLPETGNFSCGPQGSFVFATDHGFQGEIVLHYRLSSISNPDLYSDARLVILVEIDTDCDQIVNSIDIDDDNDGILDFHEGDESVDTDADGIPDCLDIDSDNDGITDFTEWQTEGFCKSLLLCDNNKDGWDDAFDPAEGGDYYPQVDTDMDGIPDFQDFDSDNDGISDFIEGFDIGNDQLPAVIFSNRDFDADGLDNSCDTINRTISQLNPMGSNCPLPDNDTNNIRDWRDPFNYVIEVDPQFAQTGENELIVYPNPVIDECTVVLPANDNALVTTYSLKIYDLKGSLEHLELFEGKERRLSLAHLKKGIYVVRVKAGIQEFVTRISKLH